MSELRDKLAGRPYCNDIKQMLPELSKAQIRNLVNGRGESLLVLAALKIVLHKLDSKEQQSQRRLAELEGELMEMSVAA